MSARREIGPDERAVARVQAIEMLSDLRRRREERAVARNQPMPAAEFKATLDQIGLLSRLTLDLDLGRFLLACDRAETLGPFLDPTLNQQFLFDPMARVNMDAMKDLAQGLLEVRRTVEQLIEKAAE